MGKKHLTSEQYEKYLAHLAEKVSEQARPEGFTNTIAATWNAGWTGKAMVVFAAVGTVVSIAFLLEGLGAATGWDGVRVVSKFCDWYAAA